jgi:two-component system LytT family response regulator
MIINCLVVDDEPIAREGILEHIAQVEFLHAVASCKNAIEASIELKRNRIDVVSWISRCPK